MLTRRGLLIGTGGLIVAGCSLPDLPPPEPARVSFKHLPRLNFGVDQIVIAEAEISDPYPQQIDAQLPLPPARIARQWATDRLGKAAPAQDGKLQFTVSRAWTQSIPLSQDAVVDQGTLILDRKLDKDDRRNRRRVRQRFFTRYVRYDFTLKADLAVATAKGGEAAITVDVRRETTLSDALSLAERDRRLTHVARALGDDFNRRMEAEIKSHLSDFLV